MTTRTVAVGDILPHLELQLPDGSPLSAGDLKAPAATLIYFMRTASCPVCNHHIRAISRATVGIEPMVNMTLIVVPGGPKEAAAIQSRHPQFAGRVVGSETAHESMGLFSKVGMQRSGTVVVDSDYRVTHATFATIPVQSLDLDAATNALAAQLR